MPDLMFSVPYNDDARTMAKLVSMRRRGGNSIREVYLGVPQSIAGSGRVGCEMTMDRFLKTVDSVHEAGIAVDLTMNSTCEGASWYDEEAIERTVGFVSTMHVEHGVEAVTLANPFYISAVREACPRMEISASVLADIDCYERAEAFARAGANTMTVDTSINRNVKLLEQIAAGLGVEVKLMVNEGCLNKCPYRKFHMNYISHRSHDARCEGSGFSFACADMIERDRTHIFRSNWVRPEELSRYASATRFFKIVGRDMLMSKVVRSVAAYMDESYDGNLLDLLCSSIGFYNVEQSAYVDNKALGRSSYFKRLSACNRKCHACAYCQKLVDEHVRYGCVTEENLLDMGQYALASAVKSQFGGSFPACRDYATRPRAQV